METTQSPKKTENDKNAWYFIVVQDPGTPDEQVMGYEHEDTANRFIPAFKSKEEAQQCFLLMPKDIMGHKFEVQAIIDEDLLAYAEKSGFAVFLMNDKGRILEQVS